MNNRFAFQIISQGNVFMKYARLSLIATAVLALAACGRVNKAG